ncbi:hypothetical protein [Algibacter sp. 2305UL17-15]|uniref:hypothetical protein n=1 Tax=Algibacter sp. 2305UL17-15 TaxID=3231268 RepID=UPI00345957BD
MHKITSILLMLLISVSSISFAQTKEELKKFALRDAKITAEATLKKDFETVFKHTYPTIIKVMGGKEKALELLKTTFKKIEEQGLIFEKSDIISVSEVVFEDDQYRCYVESLNQIKMNNMRIKSKSYLLGIYSEDKKIWYFLEAEKLKDKAMEEMILPNFKTGLNIPKDEVTTEQI